MTGGRDPFTCTGGALATLYMCRTASGSRGSTPPVATSTLARYARRGTTLCATGARVSNASRAAAVTAIPRAPPASPGKCLRWTPEQEEHRWREGRGVSRHHNAQWQASGGVGGGAHGHAIPRASSVHPVAHRSPSSTLVLPPEPKMSPCSSTKTAVPTGHRGGLHARKRPRSLTDTPRATHHAWRGLA